MTIKPTPVVFASHGSTMMLGEDSAPGRYWESVGREAVKRGVKGVIFMGAHWESTGRKFEVASNPGNPKKQPVSWVTPDKYQDYQINVSPELANKVVDALQSHGIEAQLNPDVEWGALNFPSLRRRDNCEKAERWKGIAVHDVFLVLNWMFPESSLPCTLISQNAFYDPWTFIDVGAALRPLRYENYLIVGSGGTVHNLYRNHWSQVILYRDNFAQEKPPERWALDFRTAAEDALTKNSGPALKKAAVRLMKHPLYREAHATDDHYSPVLFCVGAAGGEEDSGTLNRATSEVWELQNMCNTQFQFGEW